MKQKLMSVDEHLKEMLKDPHFREAYELDREKVELVKIIVRYRVKHHLTQGQLAKKVKVSQQQISKIEECEFSNFTTIQKVLRAIGYHMTINAVPIRHRKALRVA